MREIYTEHEESAGNKEKKLKHAIRLAHSHHVLFMEVIIPRYMFLCVEGVVMQIYNSEGFLSDGLNSRVMTNINLKYVRLVI